MRNRTVLRFCLAVVLAASLLCSLGGCGTPPRPWATPDNREEFLAEKIKTNWNAFQRYSLAEEDARRDGNAAAAETYREAKDKARQEYERYNQEMQQFKAERGQNRARP